MLHLRHFLLREYMKYGDNNVLVSIAGCGAETLIAKIKELDRYKIDTAALFLTMVDKSERKSVYKALLESNIKRIPFVHLRNDMSVQEINLLEQNFQPSYYNIHETGFRYYHKWPKIAPKIYLELGGLGKHNPAAKVEKLAGFCIDLAHFKVGEVGGSETYRYAVSKKKCKSLFACNHLNGYDARKNNCNHHPHTIRQFDFLQDLPSYLFGKLIALEMENPIKEQLVWRKKILAILGAKFKRSAG